MTQFSCIFTEHNSIYSGIDFRQGVGGGGASCKGQRLALAKAYLFHYKCKRCNVDKSLSIGIHVTIEMVHILLFLGGGKWYFRPHPCPPGIETPISMYTNQTIPPPIQTSLPGINQVKTVIFFRATGSATWTRRVTQSSMPSAARPSVMATRTYGSVELSPQSVKVSHTLPPIWLPSHHRY